MPSFNNKQGGAAAVDDEADRAGPFSGPFFIFGSSPSSIDVVNAWGVHETCLPGAGRANKATFDHHDQLGGLIRGRIKERHGLGLGTMTVSRIGIGILFSSGLRSSTP